MVAAGEVPLRLRRDAGVGGASWDAIMRPSCCSDSRPSSPLQHHHNCSGVVAALLSGQQLQGVPVVLHGVVPPHSPAVLETQDMPQARLRTHGPECRLGTLGRTPKRRLKRGRNCCKTALACGAVVAPASRSSVINRSWKVPAVRSTRPFA